MKLMIYFCDKHLDKYFKEVNKEFDVFKLEQSITICSQFYCNTLAYNVIAVETSNNKFKMVRK